MNDMLIFNGIHACFAGAIQLIAQKITKPNSIIDYFYDPMGNRIGKAYTENNQTTYTWYVRDAQGNPMATYEQKTVNNAAQLKLIELPIYGSSRIGMLQPNKVLDNSASVNTTFSIGRKQYEISNHLGNVLTTISDAKQAISNGQGQVAYYNPIIKTQQDYYPFGMLMPERQYEQPSGYEDVTTNQTVTNFTIYSNDFNGNVTGADKILDQNNYPNTSSTTDNGKFKIASTQNATTSYGYFYAIEARQGTYTITFDYEATGSANRRFFVSAYNLNSQGVATDLLYPINTQNMTNGSKTFTFTYSNTGRQYLSFAFYISNHTNPLATRFFTIDNFTVKFTGNYPFTETVALYDGKDYRYGFNGQERTDEVYGRGNLNTALFWEYDTRLGRRWNMDPKPNPSLSSYATFALNPLLFKDILGDTVSHAKFSDKINSSIARIFNKEFRNKYREWKSDEQTFTIEKANSTTSRLTQSEPFKDENNENNNFVLYSQTMNLSDVSNPILRESAWGINEGFNLMNDISMLPLGLMNGVGSLFSGAGWGMANRIETTGGFNVLSWGIGNYNEYNMHGQRLDKSVFGSKKIKASDGLLGLRIGQGGNPRLRPVFFIDIANEILVADRYQHIHLNFASKKVRRYQLRNEKIISGEN